MRRMGWLAAAVCGWMVGGQGAQEVLVSHEGDKVVRWAVSADGTRWTEQGVFASSAGTDLRPTGVAGHGDVVYVGDASDGGRIRLFGRDGRARGIFTKTGFRPDQLCVSPDGRWLYVSNLGQGVARYATADGRGGLYIKDPRAGMRGLAFGGDGFLYVGCRGDQAIRVFDVSDDQKAVLKGRLALVSCTGAVGFVADGTVAGFGRRSYAIDLVRSAGRLVTEMGRLTNAIGATRVAGGLAVGDWATGKILFLSGSDGLARTVAETAPHVCALHAFDAPPLPRPAKPFAYRAPQMTDGSDFARMAFNNPDAVTFLKGGFGTERLFVYDYDGDGDSDVIVTSGWKGQVWEGAFLFRHPGGGTDPVFPKAERIDRATLPPTRIYRGADGRPLPLPLVTNVCFTARQCVDYDGDGHQDLVVAQGVRPFAVAADLYDSNGDTVAVQMRAFLYVCRHVSGDGETARYAKPEKIYLENALPLETFGWLHALFEDWDGDGDLDIIANDFMDTLTFFENVGTRTRPVYTAGRFLRTPDGARLHGDLCMSTIVKYDWDGDGRPDIIIGEEDSRVGWMRNTGRLAKGLPVFERVRYFRQQADELNFGVLSTPAVYDFDGDGDEDVISGNSHGQIAWLENLSGPGVEKPMWAAPVYLTEPDGKKIWILAGPNGSIQGPCESKWGYTTVSVADWDGDGLPDVMANSIWGLVRWWRNIGTRTKPAFDFARSVRVAWNGRQPAQPWGWLTPEHLDDPSALLIPWRTTPVMTDWNQDGLMDLLAMDVDGDLAFFERARAADGTLVLKAPRKAFRRENGQPLLWAYAWQGGPAARWQGRVGLCGRRKFCVCDWNGDGKMDLVWNESPSAGVWLQTAAKDGTWTFRPAGPVGCVNIASHDPQPAVCDFNGDGKPDLILGAMDGYFYYLKNPASRP